MTRCLTRLFVLVLLDLPPFILPSLLGKMLRRTMGLTRPTVAVVVGTGRSGSPATAAAFVSRRLSLAPGPLTLDRRHNILRTSGRIQHQKHHQQQLLRSNFSFAGPQKLTDVMKTELLEDKSSTEISDIWLSYHETKERVHGIVIDGDRGKGILSRAANCKFFLHPVFREGGHFMIMSQFQEPNHFLLAFLEDYKIDPNGAHPLLTISIFDELAEKGVSLVRCDIINRGISEEEGYKISQSLLDEYSAEGETVDVSIFNNEPGSFDVDAFIKRKERQWNEDSSTVDARL